MSAYRGDQPPTRAGRLLLDNWQEHGGRARPGIRPARIEEFEREIDCALPADFRGTLLMVDGLEEGTWCKLGKGADRRSLVTFWSFESIVARARTEQDPATLRVLPFADYLLSWCEYAACLRGEDYGRVLKLSPGGETVIAKSFERFVEMYIQGKRALFM